MGPSCPGVTDTAAGPKGKVLRRGTQKATLARPGLTATDTSYQSAYGFLGLAASPLPGARAGSKGHFHADLYQNSCTWKGFLVQARPQLELQQGSMAWRMPMSMPPCSFPRET